MKAEERGRALDDLYGLISDVSERTGGPRRLGSATGRDGWPTHGVYVFFEPGEVREDGRTSRVVRVGTHGLTSTSRSDLWTRLRTHRGQVGGQNPGGGNHRGSVFRFHVGTALMAHGDYPDAADSWGREASATRDVRRRELALERAVSEHIGNMEVVCFPVAERAHRAAIERSFISLLSNHERVALDPPSEAWLGRTASRAAIRSSGLWNVDHIARAPDDTGLGLLQRQHEAPRQDTPDGDDGARRRHRYRWLAGERDAFFSTDSLRAEDVPPPLVSTHDAAAIEVLNRFAHTFNGYDWAGSVEELGDRQMESHRVV